MMLKNNVINIIHQNIRSMRQNFDSFLVELSSWDKFPEVIILSEIWVKNIELQLYSLPNYKLFANTNEGYRAGGIAVYIANEINNFECENLSFRTADCLKIKLNIFDSVFYIVAIYRLQDYSINMFVNELQDFFSKRNNFKMSENIIFIGDVNIDILKQDNNEVEFYKIVMASEGFESLINVPTRVTVGTCSCIDHVFARPASSNKVGCESTVIRNNVTDHYTIVVRLVSDNRVMCSDGPPPTLHNATRISYDKLNELLEAVDWSVVYGQANASTAYDLFEGLIQQCIVQATVTLNCKSVKKKLKPWITNYLSQQITKRNELYKKIKNKPLDDKFRKYYITFRNKLNKKIKFTKFEYYKRKFENNYSNPKAMWKTVKEVAGQAKSKNNFSLISGSVVISDPLTIANMFNKYFLTVVDEVVGYQNIPNNFENMYYKDFFPIYSEHSSILITYVHKEDVEKAIKSLKNGKSPGRDGISSMLLKSTYSSYLDVITYIINLSFKTGVFPDKLKNAVVVPIHKAGPTTTCSNFRPISLISTISKIFEKIMKEKVLRFLQNTKFFSDRQFGFRVGINTEAALLKFVGEIIEGINEGKVVSGLFLDIKKAFDTVNHNILLEKLYNCGIRGVVNDWFRSYLNGRKQSVRINGCYSDMGDIKHGVPQGSVLGATLFIIYINDLCKASFKGSVTAFADDTAFCYIENTQDVIEMNIKFDLGMLKWWFTKNKLVLSPEKTNFINFSLRSNTTSMNSVYYKCLQCLDGDGNCLNCNEICITSKVKYLGIILDKELSWKSHLSNVRSKLISCIRLFYFLRRVCSIQILRSLYFALVQSRLEYGIACWGGTYKTALNSISILQKCFIRIILSKHKTEASYPCFLQLNILPLRNLYIYKVLKIFFLNSGSLPEIRNPYRDKLRTVQMYKVPRPNCTFYTKYFNFVAPRIFNKLPLWIKVLKDKNKFLRSVKNWLLNIENMDALLVIEQ